MLRGIIIIRHFAPVRRPRERIDPMQKKKIGLLGGFSYASTLQYYNGLMELYYERAHDYYYPELVIYSLDFQKFTDMEDERRLDDYKEYILYGIDAIRRAGADFFAMTANSPHSVLEDIRPALPLPVVSIVDAVADEVQRQGLRKVLLTGIKYTMQMDFYQKGLAKRGIETIVPGDAHKDEINELIFGELVRGIIREETRERFKKIISAYDTEGVLLCCTELPLLLQQEHYENPLFDSMALHIKSIMDYALKEE